MQDTEQLEERILNVEMTLDEIMDELGSRIKLKREYQRHKQILEGLVVKAFGLSNVDELHVHPKADGPGKAHPRSGYLKTEESPARTAIVILYYILWQHNTYATRKQLEGDYGYSTRFIQTIFPRLELIHKNRLKRQAIEREFLDMIGLPDEPITELTDGSISRAAWYKMKCRNHGIAYRRSHVE
jgi:hypothetical protein